MKKEQNSDPCQTPKGTSWQFLEFAENKEEALTLTELEGFLFARVGAGGNIKK